MKNGYESMSEKIATNSIRIIHIDSLGIGMEYSISIHANSFS